MNNVLNPCLLSIALLTLAAPLQAQTAEQLRRENTQLKAELAALQSRCPATGGGLSPPVSHVGDLEARLDSVRLGVEKHVTRATVTMTLRNTSRLPMILNYELKSFAATDSNGYRYTFPGMENAAYVKGIPVATASRVDGSFQLQPGRSTTVTFLARRDMANGQTAGDRFDISASFGQYEDMGQGRLRRVQTFPVAFQNQPAGAAGGAAQIGDQAGQAVENAAGRLLDRLLK